MDSTVVCSGTIIAGRDALLSYLQLMSHVTHFIAKESCFEQFGVDQGFHNFILHYLKPNRPDLLHFEALQVHNDDSPIYTLGLVDTENRVKVVGNSFELLNAKGMRAPVVHQVDRKTTFREHKDEFALSTRRLRQA